MLIGFKVISRENNEEDCTYWLPIRNLPAFYWMLRKEPCPQPNCKYCNDPTGRGCCLIFTYEPRPSIT